LAVADVNGDGKPDALVTNYNGGTLGVLLGNGAGGFTLQPNPPQTGTNSNPFGVAVADVNGDGKPDALVINFTSNTLGVLIGNGAGGFTLQPNLPQIKGIASYKVTVADVNGDSKPDALVPNYSNNTLQVLLGDGAGGFTSRASLPSTGANSAPFDVAVADINGDGKPDALTANTSANTLGVLLGDGAGGFTLQPNSPQTGANSGPQSVVVVDVNGDGKLDALTANSRSSTLGVLLGDGKGGFVLQANLPSTGVSSGPFNVVVADVNGDGKLDALASNYNTNTLGVLLGNGAGGFTLQLNSPAVGIFDHPSAVAVADVNGDRKPDALMISNNTSVLGVLLNTTVLATAAVLPAAVVDIYPNPAHAAFSVQVPGVGQAGSVQATLLNGLGQVVSRQSAALPVAGTTLLLETAGLAAGVYTLRLTAGATVLARRVVVQ